MALFKRENSLSSNAIPPAPSARAEVRTSNRPSWIVLLGAVVAILLISTLLVFGGRWVYRSITNDSNKEPAPQTTQQAKSTQNTSSSSNNSNNSSSQKSSGSSSSSNSSSATGSNSGSQSTDNLPNNGPGGVAAIFLAASVAAAGLHYLVNLRRSS